MEDTKFTRSDTEHIAYQLLLMVGKRLGYQKIYLKTYFPKNKEAKIRYNKIAMNLIKTDFDNSDKFRETFSAAPINHGNIEKESEHMRKIVLERFESQK